MNHRDDAALYFGLPNQETDILGDRWVARLSHEYRARQGDLAAEARAGGRLLTNRLARFAGPPVSREYMARGVEAGNVDHVWSYYIDPSVRSSLYEGTAEQKQARRDRWASNARAAAGMGNFPDTQHGDPQITAVILEDAEAMVSWPIYRAAIFAQTRDMIDSSGHSTMRGLSSVDLDNLDQLGDRGLIPGDHPSQDPILDAEVLNRPSHPGLRPFSVGGRLVDPTRPTSALVLFDQHLNRDGQQVTLCGLPFGPADGPVQNVYDHRDGFDPKHGAQCTVCADEADAIQNGGR